MKQRRTEMSFIGTMTTEQLVQNGFYISPDNSDLAICKLYPNLSMRHRCQKCGNWSRSHNGQCPQCFIGRSPLKPTKQYFKVYTQCCGDQNCELRREASAFLNSAGMDTKWTGHDRYGAYVSLSPVQSWSEEDRNEFFADINEFSVSKFGARLLCHPDSKNRSKLSI